MVPVGSPLLHRVRARGLSPSAAARAACPGDAPAAFLAATLAVCLAGCEPAAPGPGFVPEGDDDDAVDPCGGRPRWDPVDLAAFPVGPEDLPPDGRPCLGMSAVLVDLDRDGALDVFAASNCTPPVLLYGDGGGGFDEAPADDGIPADIGLRSAVAADADGDGLPDLLVFGPGSGMRFFRNEGGRHFRDVAAERGVACAPDCAGFGGAFGDVDGDSDLDLFIACHIPDVRIDEVMEGGVEPNGDCLLLQQDDGTFTDASSLFPEGSLDGLSFQGALDDLDLDGDLDVLVVNDFGPWVAPNRAFRNEGTDPSGLPVFTDVGQESGLGISTFGMGIALGDTDRDGDRDAVVTTMPGVIHLVSAAPWEYFDATALDGLGGLGTAEHDVGWAAVREDLDNDGWLDLLVAFDHLGAGEHPEYGLVDAEEQRRVVSFGTPEGFVQADPPTELEDDHTSSALATGDVNRDGTPDVLGGMDDGLVRLYLSRPECTRGRWLSVSVDLPGTRNPHGIGATVTVEARGETYRGSVDGGGRASMSTSAAEVHFGLGDAERAERVEARLPDGTVLVAEDVAGDGAVVLAP